MSDTKSVRTRIAPSPTGEYHIGHLRTCLYDYALAKQSGGQFIIRIEDTDQKRYVKGAADRVLNVIRNYGLTWDEGPDIGGPFAPYVQTQRLETYRRYSQQLLDEGKAYYCFCSESRLAEMREAQKAAKQVTKYDQRCLHLAKQEIDQKIADGEKPVVRLKVPDNQIVSFKDAIRGEIKFNTNDIDDQILIKSSGIPTYHFAVVVDDHLMEITHIFRGEEWITSTPKQILLYQYLGWKMPIFAHLTVLMDPSGHGKMSKRHGATAASSFLEEGYLPEAMLNFLMLLGWNPGDNREMFTLDEFVKEFSLEHLHKKSPSFDRNKLDYFNGVYIRQKSVEELSKLLKPFIPKATDKILMQIIPLIHDRIKTLKEAAAITKFLFEDVEYDPTLLTAKVEKNIALDMLIQAKNIITSDFPDVQIKLMDLIKTNNWKVGDFFMVFRVAICGATQTPPVVDCLPIVGKEATLRKLQKAVDLLN